MRGCGFTLLANVPTIFKIGLNTHVLTSEYGSRASVQSPKARLITVPSYSLRPPLTTGKNDSLLDGQVDSFGSPRRLSPPAADQPPIRASSAMIAPCVSQPPAFAHCEPPPPKRKRPLGPCSVIVDWARNSAGKSASKTASWIFTASNIGWRLSSMAVSILRSTRCAKMPPKKTACGLSAFDCCAFRMRWCWGTRMNSCGRWGRPSRRR